VFYENLNKQIIEVLNKKSFILISESSGYGLVLEKCNDKDLAIQKTQRFFDLQFNQIDPDFDINTEFGCLRNYKYPENTYLENSPQLKFQVSNGVNSAYVIEIDEDQNIDDVVYEIISKREN
jgi:hypothetical protein